MDEAPVGVFVVTLEGLEGGAPPVLTILAFIRAETEAGVGAVALREAARDGFDSLSVLRIAEVVDTSALPDDFRPALDGALRYGAWLIVYDQP